MRAARFCCLGLLAIAAASCASSQSVGAQAPALVGTWAQAEAECARAEPVRELVFTADGRYSVTWAPFETYKDYWGAWRYDAATGVLTLSVEGGNYQPSDRVLSGEVRADARQLSLGAISLGAPEQGGRCTAPFRR